jgi:hypothetical protein
MQPQNVCCCSSQAPTQHCHSTAWVLRLALVLLLLPLLLGMGATSCQHQGLLAHCHPPQHQLLLLPSGWLRQQPQVLSAVSLASASHQTHMLLEAAAGLLPQAQ